MPFQEKNDLEKVREAIVFCLKLRPGGSNRQKAVIACSLSIAENTFFLFFKASFEALLTTFFVEFQWGRKKHGLVKASFQKVSIEVATGFHA